MRLSGLHTQVYASGKALVFSLHFSLSDTHSHISEGEYPRFLRQGLKPGSHISVTDNGND